MFGGGRSQKQNDILITFYNEYVLEIKLITVEAKLDHLVEVVFVFSISKLLFPFFLSTLYSKGKSLCTGHT